MQVLISTKLKMFSRNLEPFRFGCGGGYRPDTGDAQLRLVTAALGKVMSPG